MQLIFDFDGTLIDSFDCLMNKIILLADEFQFKKFDKNEIKNLRDLTSNEIIKYLQVPIHKIPNMIYQLRKYLRDEMQSIKPIPNIQPVLEKLRQAGFSLGILTSNSMENVTTWLAYNNLEHYFNFIRIESNYFSKKYALKKTLKSYKIEKAKTFYICDETRDLEAAKKNGIKSIAVTWGYHSEKILLQYHPAYIARQPEDILHAVGIAATEGTLHAIGKRNPE